MKEYYTIGFEEEVFKIPKRFLNQYKKEIIDDRHRIHKINLECARQGAKKEVFDDIEKYRVKTGCIIISETASMVLKQKHLKK